MGGGVLGNQLHTPAMLVAYIHIIYFYFLVIATVALAFLLLPMCQYLIRPCSDGTKISFGVCGRYTGAELLSFTLSIMIVCIWVLTGELLPQINIFLIRDVILECNTGDITILAFILNQFHIFLFDGSNPKVYYCL